MNLNIIITYFKYSEYFFLNFYSLQILILRNGSEESKKTKNKTQARALPTPLLTLHIKQTHKQPPGLRVSYTVTSQPIMFKVDSLIQAIEKSDVN